MQGEIRQWVDEKAQRAEETERRGDVKELCNITKKLSKRSFRRNKPVRNNRGVILSTQDEPLKRRREYF